MQQPDIARRGSSVHQQGLPRLGWPLPENARSQAPVVSRLWVSPFCGLASKRHELLCGPQPCPPVLFSDRVWHLYCALFLDESARVRDSWSGEKHEYDATDMVCSVSPQSWS